jgi:hypothetical protein
MFLLQTFVLFNVFSGQSPRWYARSGIILCKFSELLYIACFAKIFLLSLDRIVLARETNFKNLDHAQMAKPLYQWSPNSYLGA